MTISGAFTVYIKWNEMSETKSLKFLSLTFRFAKRYQKVFLSISASHGGFVESVTYRENCELSALLFGKQFELEKINLFANELRIVDP